MKKLVSLGTLVAVSLLSAVFAVFLYSHANPIPHSSQPPNPPVNTTNFTAAAEKTVHAVVHVMTKTIRRNNSRASALFEYFYGYQAPAPRPIEGSGSGVLIDPKGYIVTNNHVISNSDEIEVTLNDKRSFKAKLVGTDPSTDIAVLKIDAQEALPYLEYGNSDALKIGEWVLAVGNPFNLTSTVTAGVISAKARNIGILSDRNNHLGIESFIQTDAAVNPGNSGGALVNTAGQLVGINSAIASPTGSFSGYSFAVPVSIVQKVVSDLIQYGQVQRALLGVSIRDISDELAKQENLQSLEGALVLSINPNGAANDAGIQEMDIITAINQQNVSSVAELQEQISRYHPGDQITVTILRKGKQKTVSVVLKNEQGNTYLSEGMGP